MDKDNNLHCAEFEMNFISTAFARKITAEESAILMVMAHPSFTTSATVAQIASAAEDSMTMRG